MNNMYKASEEIIQYVKSLGDLHDAVILNLLWYAADNRLEITVDDLYSNYLGFPEHPGCAQGLFVFYDVTQFDINEVYFAESGLKIYDWIFKEGSIFDCEISFSPGGRILIKCAQIEVKQICT